MNYQEIFNTVCDHLMQQNCQALDEDNDACSYRGEDGTKCAVGVLITDEAYTESLENKTPTDSLVQDALKASGVFQRPTLKAVKFLNSLQSIHDCPIAAKYWPKELERLAGHYGLTVPQSVKERL